MAYEYVTKQEVSIAREEIEDIIHKVQNYLRKEKLLTFQYNLIGSASNKRHLVTRIKNGNQGFDLDYNIVINKLLKNGKNNAKWIKETLISAFNQFLKNPYKKCENSTSVFTIKKLNKKNNTIDFSFDFAIVFYYEEDSVERQKYIKFDKNKNSYFLELRKIATNHRDKEQFIKENGYWSEVRDVYLEKKNKNSDPNKKSRTLYYETIKELNDRYRNY